MIILSQNKSFLANFDKCRAIEAKDYMIVILNEQYDNVGLLLGKYKTEERAKEVLQEIIHRYEYMQRNLMDSNDTSPFDEISIYRMPKE